MEDAYQLFVLYTQTHASWDFFCFFFPLFCVYTYIFIRISRVEKIIQYFTAEKKHHFLMRKIFLAFYILRATHVNPKIMPKIVCV